MRPIIYIISFWKVAESWNKAWEIFADNAFFWKLQSRFCLVTLRHANLVVVIFRVGCDNNFDPYSWISCFSSWTLDIIDVLNMYWIIYGWQKSKFWIYWFQKIVVETLLANNFEIIFLIPRPIENDLPPAFITSETLCWSLQYYG